MKHYLFKEVQLTFNKTLDSTYLSAEEQEVEFIKQLCEILEEYEEETKSLQQEFHLVY